MHSRCHPKWCGAPVKTGTTVLRQHPESHIAYLQSKTDNEQQSTHILMSSNKEHMAKIQKAGRKMFFKF